MLRVVSSAGGPEPEEPDVSATVFCFFEAGPTCAAVVKTLIFPMGHKIHCIILGFGFENKEL